MWTPRYHPECVNFLTSTTTFQIKEWGKDNYICDKKVSFQNLISSSYYKRVLLQHRHFKISCITCYISYESLKHIFHFKFRVGKKLIFSMVETWTKKHINNGETFSALLFMK